MDQDYPELVRTYLQRHRPRAWAALTADPEQAERYVASLASQIREQIQTVTAQLQTAWSPPEGDEQTRTQMAAQATAAAREVVLADLLSGDEQTEAETDATGGYTGWKDGQEPLLDDWPTLMSLP